MKNLSLFLIILAFPYILWAQHENEVPIDSLNNSSPLGEVTDTVPVINFFETDESLPITLKYDITSFIRNKNKGEYLDAELIVNYKDLAPVIKNIRIKARGNFRRGQCYFPPIYLNFKTDPFLNTELKGMKKVKIVTHCSNTKSNQKYILKEYLAYKLFNVLSDNSFRVHLLDISYIDTGKKKKNYKEFGFIIEPIELVAKRQNSVLIDPKFVRGTNIKNESADQVALFEYMIANTDWRFKSGHNMKYIKSLNEITDKVIAVPYDFDFSGFVDTDYSFPQEWTTIDDVKEREYLGYCRNDEKEYLKVITSFLEKKQDIKETINSFAYLDEKEKIYLIEFLEDFFNELTQSDSFIKILKSQCRTDF